jgi:hypothetical protein
MLHAEKQAKRPSGKNAWSPRLREAGLLARYWHRRLREVDTDCCLQAPLSALSLRIKSLNIELSEDLSTDALILKERWRAAFKTLRAVRNTAYGHCAVHLLSTITRYQTLTFTEDERSKEAENAKKSLAFSGSSILRTCVNRAELSTPR